MPPIAGQLLRPIVVAFRVVARDPRLRDFTPQLGETVRLRDVGLHPREHLPCVDLIALADVELIDHTRDRRLHHDAALGATTTRLLDDHAHFPRVDRADLVGPARTVVGIGIVAGEERDAGRDCGENERRLHRALLKGWIA